MPRVITEAELPAAIQQRRQREREAQAARRRLAVAALPPAAPVTRQEFTDLLIALGIK